jgi:hypothetical protein
MPQLSGSVDSVADEEAVEFTSESAPMDIVRPRIRRQDSCASSRSRGKEPHITPNILEKMVTSIVHQKEPLTAPLPEIALPLPLPVEIEAKQTPIPMLERSGSTTTESPTKTSETDSLDSSQGPPSPVCAASHHRTTVVRGFTPSPSLASHELATTTIPSEAIPAPESSPAAKDVPTKKQPTRFHLGESSYDDSASDRSQSLELRKQPVPQPKKKMFQVGLSSEEESSLKSALHSSRPNSLLNAQKKQLSFSAQVQMRNIPPQVVLDEDSDYVDESAIDDDDDSSDWEDSNEEGSGRSSLEEKNLFQRVDSKVNLASRRSLITLGLEKSEHEKKFGNVASQSTSALPRARTTMHQPALVASPNDSDEAPLMMRRGARAAPPLRPINEVPRSAAQPITTTNNGIQIQAALSPRTTRRNMLSTELTESLRRHLLWERSQKSSTANAVLKRRHTSHDVANLRQYPERVHMPRDADANAGSFDQYINRDALNGYHSKGW